MTEFATSYAAWLAAEKTRLSKFVDLRTKMPNILIRLLHPTGRISADTVGTLLGVNNDGYATISFYVGIDGEDHDWYEEDVNPNDYEVLRDV